MIRAGIVIPCSAASKPRASGDDPAHDRAVLFLNK